VWPVMKSAENYLGPSGRGEMRSRSSMRLMNATSARLFERKARDRSRSPRWTSETVATRVATATTPL
jgi:hypothetical protein